MNPEAAFYPFCSNLAEFMKTIEKLRFSYGFSRISSVRKVSTSIKNVKKSSPECLGTPKNRTGWAGSTRWAAQMAIMGFGAARKLLNGVCGGGSNSEQLLTKLDCAVYTP